MQLELHDIQGTVLRNRPMPYFGSYVLFSIENAAAARTLIERLIPHVTSAADWDSPKENAWINIVFTYEGLRRLGIPEAFLDQFPVEFKMGMAARKKILGDIGRSDPAYWDLPHGNTGFHVGLLVMAGSEQLKEKKLKIGHNAIAELPGITLIARLDVGVPPNLREHFGYADGFSRPFIAGQGGEPLPGQGEPAKAGEFILGYENELGKIAAGPGPEIFWKNGTYISIRKIKQDVMAFRKFLTEQAGSKEGQERVAAKIMGRWRSGCPLALSPDKDDPTLVADPMRNNAFAYYQDDLDGKITPPGCHIRRVNPRDGLKDSIVDARLHRLLRRGAAYGPMLPEDATEDDGIERGIIISFINANPARQFEFVQSQWVNDGDFISEGSRTDPIVGRRDIKDDYAYPDKPVRKRIKGLPDFTATRGGEHTFLPGISALKWMVSQGWNP
ncbi:Dyp-type peroxidase [Chitinophaga tropicalis]|uniref:Peroxidase n=1 Tax=Chitinophaga tropicalis TaxID=2683588 RepID=A0A7K1U4Z5_9BACT|nr:peroxidase [Chitinophaga tropicalis]MVT09433.1 peroxidase [Chitinophaga tropicalis]